MVKWHRHCWALEVPWSLLGSAEAKKDASPEGDSGLRKEGIFKKSHWWPAAVLACTGDWWSSRLGACGEGGPEALLAA